MKPCYPMLPSDLTDRLEIIDRIITKPNEWIYEEKVDGIRIITIVSNGRIYCYTRNGLRQEKLEKWLQLQAKWKAVKNETVFDGEVYWKNLRTTHSILSGPSEIHHLEYYLFDIFPYSSCETVYMVPLKRRKRILLQSFKAIEPLRTLRLIKGNKLTITNPGKLKDEIFDLVDKFVEHGWEGIVLKHIESPYIHDRTKLWWKVKKFYSLDLLCKDVVESKTHKEMLGGIVVDACGTDVVVGSGFTNKQRILFWKHPELIVGKIVEVRYFERLPSGKFRFPVFVRIREDKDKPDC